MKIVIEHLEDELWPWIYLEYENISNFLGKRNIIFTNIWNEKWIPILDPLGKTIRKSVLDFPDKSKIIILDPKARETLKKTHIYDDDLIVIGGILGEIPPRGRTYKYLTSKIRENRVRTYNIGKNIYPTDAAAAIAYLIYKGYRIEEIKTINNLEIKYSRGSKMILPFSYPIINNKVFINPKLTKLLIKEEPLHPNSEIWTTRPNVDHKDLITFI